MSTMVGHFAKVAPKYRYVRTTDIAPVRWIQSQLASAGRLKGADVACGDGRYDQLLFDLLGERLELFCIDANSAMLGQLDRHFRDSGVHNYKPIVAASERIPLETASLDFLMTFNAVHHFDFDGFLEEAARVVRPGGQIFVYTRVRSQNARNIWGRHFPEFSKRETRLFEIDETTNAVAEHHRLRLDLVQHFEHPRESHLPRLVDQARSKHYSTFSLYSPEEFEDALAVFEATLRRSHAVGVPITWQDENVLLHLRRSQERQNGEEPSPRVNEQINALTGIPKGW